MPEVSFTFEFKRNLRALSRKYRSIRSDVQPIIEQLKNDSLPGSVKSPRPDQVKYISIFSSNFHPHFKIQHLTMHPQHRLISISLTSIAFGGNASDSISAK